ncbi:MAG: multicopper oxidase domain-containing protein [Alphaproteobacteria bacterium]|nr:multicopper oxidase domain-containing protein [Alphaproteobacteria bacterium]
MGSGLLAGCATAQQTGEPRLFANPPALTSAAPAAVPGRGAMLVSQPPAGNKLSYDLTIKMTRGHIFDPAHNRDQPVRLRSYVDTNLLPASNRRGKKRFIAPLINATPGDTVRVMLRNTLAADPSCAHEGPLPETPHCFNGTNLHTHGLWISPTGNSDNVLLSINPGVDFQYEYNIPVDHPAGTFWYHPHRHGSTALQVSSGMAGALIIRGDRKPRGVKGTRKAKNGDLDTLLVAKNGTPFKERTVVFEQIQYACLGPDGKLKYRIDKDGNKVIDWSCKPREVGVIESYDQFGPGTWAASGRWTSINGTVLPTFHDVKTGQVERWRLIHAGVRDTIIMQFRKASSSLAVPQRLAKTSLPKTLKEDCSGDPVPYQVVAADGLTMDRTITTDKVTLQPGYRYDLLTIFPEPGLYCMIEPPSPRSGSVSDANEAPNLLGYVKVSGGKAIAVSKITEKLVETLVQSAEAHMPVGVKKQIVRDLKRTDPKSQKPTPHLTRFVAHPTVTEAEVAASKLKTEEMVFFIDVVSDPKNVGFFVGNSFDVVRNPRGKYVPKGAAPYGPDRVDRALALGKTQQWELRSYSVSHPFHIHVNPFQIVAVYDPDGKDVSLPGVVEHEGTKDEDSQFAGLKGVWKDTLWVKTDLNPGQLTNPPKDYYRMIVRTRYQRYIGEFVLHCHILDHEDQGMMQNVSVVLPQH